VVFACQVQKFTHLADIDISHSVVIDIHHGGSARPFGRHAAILHDFLQAADAGLSGYIPEVYFAFIDVKFIFAHIGREIEVGQSVLVKIGCSHATPVKEVHVVQSVDSQARFQYICEVEAGFFVAE